MSIAEPQAVLVFVEKTPRFGLIRVCRRLLFLAQEAKQNVQEEEHLNQLIEDQPEDSSELGIVQELAFDAMVKRGVADAKAKRTLSNEEVGRLIQSWQD